MNNMDLENGGAGGGALNNQQEEAARGGDDGVELVTPDPAADYLSWRLIAFQCVLAVMYLGICGLLVGLGFAKFIPWTRTSDHGWVVSHSVSRWAAFVTYLVGGGVALAVGCGLFAMLCCMGSNSKLMGLG